MGVKNMIRYEDTDPWYVRHGAALGAVLAFVLLFAIFAWGMSM